MRLPFLFLFASLLAASCSWFTKTTDVVDQCTATACQNSPGVCAAVQNDVANCLLGVVTGDADTCIAGFLNTIEADPIDGIRLAYADIACIVSKLAQDGVPVQNAGYQMTPTLRAKVRDNAKLWLKQDHGTLQATLAKRQK